MEYLWKIWKFCNNFEIWLRFGQNFEILKKLGDGGSLLVDGGNGRATRDWNFESVADGPTNQRTWVGARNTCVSHNVPWNTTTSAKCLNVTMLS